MGRRRRELAALRSIEQEVWGVDASPLASPEPEPRSVLQRLATHVSDRRVRLLRFLRFAVVGASGIVVNEVAAAVFVSALGLHYVVGVLLSTQCSTLWNFALFEVWAFKSTAHKRRGWHRWLMLMLVNNVANVATLPILVLCTSVFGINYLISNLFTLVIVIVARFALADWIWAPADLPAAAVASEW
jgi:putative flippase GtrA